MHSVLATLLLPGLSLPLAAGDPAPVGARVPAVPLVTHTPYFTVWSCADGLTQDVTRHWTGRPHPLTSLVRVDGKTFRLMGTTPEEAPALPQVDLQITATRTTYQFANDTVRVGLTFLTPSLPGDLDVLARPVSYLTWRVEALDGRTHRVEVLFTASSLLAVDDDTQKVEWHAEAFPGLETCRVGSIDQPVLARKGDNLAIDWGWCYLAAPQDEAARVGVHGRAALEATFAREGAPPAAADTRMPRAAGDDEPVLFAALDLAAVGAEAVQRHVLLGYDEVYAIRYFSANLRPYWRRNGAEPAELFATAERDYQRLSVACAEFDRALASDLRKAGGEDYVTICNLAYRQAIAGNGFAADEAGGPMLFPKECFSNGCIATVDVIYPEAPIFLALSPTLTKALLIPALEYGQSPRWKFPFAPHDLGTYPRATGQVYGGGEQTEDNQMPVEESGNMLLLLAALAQAEGNAGFAERYWPTITRWAEYLREKGLDPENQLCTDDFTGHLAHNANLSVKAILALAAYGRLAEMRGDTGTAREYGDLARRFAGEWVAMADDGDHTRLAFDKPGTWSQKYNLVWDRILDLGIFPPEVAEREIAFYKATARPYGLPLDPRAEFTKSDWLIWTASLATDPADFEALTAPLARFLRESPTRVPFSDWYDTNNARMVGFQARPVIGGVFLKLLYDAETWRKWVSRDTTPEPTWGPFPTEPEVETVVPCAQQEPLAWRYTVAEPAGEWFAPAFADETWAEGPAGFGSAGTPGAIIGTEWTTGDIWLRRGFELPQGPVGDLRLWAHHDEGLEIYLNGVLAARAGGYLTSYEPLEISEQAKAALRPGVNTIAVHCHQTTGGQYVDVGLVRVVPVRPSK